MVEEDETLTAGWKNIADLTKHILMKFFTDFGRYLLLLRGMFSRPENGKMYWKEFMHQCSEIGIGSLGIVAIISIFMGAVSTLQTAYQLVSPFIPLSTIAQIVRDTVILEFSPTLVCIVLAGVVGSKIASELGNMRVSEQIDALEIMGINTKSYLVMPKLLAAIVVIPMLVVISAILGILGGRLAATMTGILSASAIRQRACTSSLSLTMYSSRWPRLILSRLLFRASRLFMGTMYREGRWRSGGPVRNR